MLFTCENSINFESMVVFINLCRFLVNLSKHIYYGITSTGKTGNTSNSYKKTSNLGTRIIRKATGVLHGFLTLPDFMRFS